MLLLKLLNVESVLLILDPFIATNYESCRKDILKNNPDDCEHKLKESINERITFNEYMEIELLQFLK